MNRERPPRSLYNFPSTLKAQVRREQKNRCAVTGKKGYTEVHHTLPISIALGFWPNIDPEILKQRENAVALSTDVHNQLHDEMRRWPKEFLRLYMVGLYSYLKDTYNQKQETVIYQAVTGDK